MLLITPDNSAFSKLAPSKLAVKKMEPEISLSDKSIFSSWASLKLSPSKIFGNSTFVIWA